MWMKSNYFWASSRNIDLKSDFFLHFYVQYSKINTTFHDMKKKAKLFKEAGTWFGDHLSTQRSEWKKKFFLIKIGFAFVQRISVHWHYFYRHESKGHPYSCQGGKYIIYGNFSEEKNEDNVPPGYNALVRENPLNPKIMLSWPWEAGRYRQVWRDPDAKRGEFCGCRRNSGVKSWEIWLLDHAECRERRRTFRAVR